MNNITREHQALQEKMLTKKSTVLFIQEIQFRLWWVTSPPCYAAKCNKRRKM